nr:hypothetical protein [Bacilli bacterium]
MKKYNFVLSFAALSASILGLLLFLVPDFVNAPAALQGAYGSLFRFNEPRALVSSLLFIYALLAGIALCALCLIKKSYRNIPTAFIVFLTVFALMPVIVSLTDGLPLMGTGLAGAIFAFIGLVLGQASGIFLALEMFGIHVMRGEEEQGRFAKLKPGIKTLVASGMTLGIVIVSFALSLGAGLIGGATCSFDVAEDVDVTETKKAYFTEGRGTYDLKGDAFTLRGVNFGNYLIQEGWLSPTGLGPAKNADGSYVKVNEEGIVEEYNEVYQEELIAALENNPNLTEAQIETLWNAYYMSYAQNEDFENIKKLGLNGIRLPMDYRIFVEGEAGNLTLKDNAFYYVDRFLKMAKANGLVV